MIGPSDRTVEAQWSRLGAMFNVAPARRTPDLERLIVDSAACIPENSRLFVMAASWLSRCGRLVARHRLAGMLARMREPETSAVVGLLLDTAQMMSASQPLAVALAACRPAPAGKPLFVVDRASPALAEFVRTRASQLSLRWNLWAEPMEPKLDAIRPLAWILEKNPSFQTRAIFQGNLRASVLACLEYDIPAGASESELARLCGVTRKAAHEALDHLEFCDLIERSRNGRNFLVILKRGHLSIAV